MARAKHFNFPTATLRLSYNPLPSTPRSCFNPATMADDHPRILICDDDEAHAEAVADILDAAGRDYECVAVNTGEAAQRLMLAQSFDLALLDLKLPDIDGMMLLEVLRQRSPDTEVIIMTGHGSVARAVEALQKGAYSFLEKPLQRDYLRNQVAKALEARRLKARNQELERIVDEKYGMGGLIGGSPAMRAVFDRIKQVAPTDARVLITGPNGSGKELVARAVHFNSRRSKGRFVAFNCGAISGDLLQSQLFGHKKGAFTGADADREGLFEYADGGTLFLDEVGEMPLEAQVKLLRVLETREVTRLGANSARSVDVRLLSATNKNLEEEVRAGRFREDLYFRLRVVQIHLPPLRERGEDILLLADAFLREFAQQYGKRITGFDEDVRAALSAHAWPGNVRELRNTIEEMVVLGGNGEITADRLPPSLAGHVSSRASERKGLWMPAGENVWDALIGMPLAEVERKLIRVTLDAMGGNREKTAAALGIGERTLYRKLKDMEGE